MVFCINLRIHLQGLPAEGVEPSCAAGAAVMLCRYAKRKANVEWENYVYRTQRGEYIAVVVAVASRPVKAGGPVLQQSALLQHKHHDCAFVIL